MLRSVEDNFGLAHLGYAGQEGLRPFGSDILNNRSCGERMHLSVDPRHAEARSTQRFDFHVGSRFRRCRAGTLIKIVDPDDPADPRGLGRARTDGSGHAHIRAKLGGPSTATAVVKKKGCISDTAGIRIR
jgi:hypothetical protein